MIEFIAQTIYEAHLGGTVAKSLAWTDLSPAQRRHWIEISERVLAGIEARAEANLVPTHWLRAA